MEIQNGMLEACRANHYNLVLGPVGSGTQRAADIKGLFEYFGPDGVVLFFILAGKDGRAAMLWRFLRSLIL